MFNTTPRLPAAAIALAAATTIAACGSNSPGSSSVAGSGGQPTQAQMQRDAVRFAACMHSHGVPNWPDPATTGGFAKSKLTPQQLGVSPAQAHAASIACEHFLPSGGPPNESPTHTRVQIAAALAFARCLRGHGFPSFPDPSSTGQLSHAMLASAGINLHQPAVVVAADDCVGVTHGLLDRAAVARFIAEQ